MHEIPPEAAFAEYRATQDRCLRDQLVEEYLPLAEHIARRFDRRGEPYDDLLQVASIALVKAVERFDPDRGNAFATFAVPTIMGEVKRHFRDKAWSVRVPRRLQEIHLRLADAVDQLTHELGRSPAVREVAERLELTPDDVVEGIEAGHSYRHSSLDAPVVNAGEQTISIGERCGAADERLADVDDRAVVKQLLLELPRRERRVLTLRFFGGLTQSEIAEREGISQMHVSRLLARTLPKLREQIVLEAAS
jgi:RNA polymerase sigma-B factor